MAPSSSSAAASILSADYCSKQIVANCSFFTPKDAVITVITSKEPLGKTVTAIALKTEDDQREALLAESGRAVHEALQALLQKSEEAVHQYISTNGYELVPANEDCDDDNRSISASSTVTASDDTLSDGEDDIVSITSRSRKAKRGSRKATNSNRTHSRLSRSRSRSSVSSREASPVRSQLAGKNGLFRRPSTTARIFPSLPSRLPSGRPMSMVPGANPPPPPGSQWTTMQPPLASLRMPSVPGIVTATHPPPPPPPVPPFATNTSGRPSPVNTYPAAPVIRRPASESNFRPLAPFHAQNQNMFGAPRPPIPPMMNKPVSAVDSPTPLLPMQDVRILINWRNHGIQRVLAQARPTIRGVGGVADAALAYVRRSAPGFENVTSFDTQPSRLWSLRATVRRAVVDGDAYDLSNYAGDDLRRLLASGNNAAGEESCIPLFEVDVDTPGVPAGFFGAPALGSGPVLTPTAAPSFPPPPPSSTLAVPLCEHREEDEEEEE